MSSPIPRPPLSGPVRDPRLERLGSLAQVLDQAIRVPGTNMRIGLDGLLGLIPGVGDVATSLMAGYIILTAAQMGAPKSVLFRMAANVGIDTIVGAVPVLGDLFDFAFKSNTRNLALLRGMQERPVETRRSSVGFAAMLVLVLIMLVAGAIALSVGVVRLVGQLMS